MPAINFQRQFGPDVRLGKKRQSIRAFRKDKRDPLVGQPLHLFTGMRTKNCERLGLATVTHVAHVRIEFWRLYWIGPRGGKIKIPLKEMHKIIEADGFEFPTPFFRFFETNHGLPFEGLLIRWSDPVAPEPSPYTIKRK